MATNSTIFFNSDDQRRVAKAVLAVEKAIIDNRGVPVKRITPNNGPSTGQFYNQVNRMVAQNSSGWRSLIFGPLIPNS